MALEDATFQHGNAVFPLTAGSSNSFLQDADPAVYWCAQYFASVIATYAGARFVAEAIAAGVANASSPVAYWVPDLPDMYLQEEQVKFPLLAVARVRGDRQERTLTYRDDVGEWQVSYVLPPLTAGQRERLMPMLRAVADILDDRIDRKADASFQNGAEVFGPNYANLESIRIKSESYGTWDAGNGLTFPALVLTLEVKERQNFPDGAYQALAGVDASQTDAKFTATSPTPGNLNVDITTFANIP